MKSISKPLGKAPSEIILSGAIIIKETNDEIPVSITIDTGSDNSHVDELLAGTYNLPIDKSEMRHTIVAGKKYPSFKIIVDLRVESKIVLKNLELWTQPMGELPDDVILGMTTLRNLNFSFHHKNGFCLFDVSTIPENE